MWHVIRKSRIKQEILFELSQNGEQILPIAATKITFGLGRIIMIEPILKLIMNFSLTIYDVNDKIL